MKSNSVFFNRLTVCQIIRFVQQFHLPTIFSTHTKAVNMRIWRKITNTPRHRRFGTQRIIQNSTSKSKNNYFSYGHWFSFPTEILKNGCMAVANDRLECCARFTSLYLERACFISRPRVAGLILLHATHTSSSRPTTPLINTNQVALKNYKP